MSEARWLWIGVLAVGCQGGTSATGEDASSTGEGEAASSGTGEAPPTTGGPATTGGGEDTGDASSGDGSSGGEPVDCDDEDRPYAPPPVMIDGALAVPIDILELDGTFTIDYVGRTARAHAELRFRVGAEAGRPIFDLRQDGPHVGSLDGAAIDTTMLPEVDFGGGPGAQMRVLGETLPACSEHLLILDYPLEKMSGFAAPPPTFDEDGVVWDLGFNDVAPRMFLEQWLPANLIHDRHAITLTVEVVDGPAGQRVISNGMIEELAPAVWQVEFPASSTAQSPMLVLAPGWQVDSSSTTLETPGGAVGVELHRMIGIEASSAGLHDLLAGAFAEFTASTGDYLYPSFTAVVLVNGGMEYDGGTTSSVEALVHELFHSWYGRGVRPARASDGWFDEAWNEYNTEFPLLPAEPMDPGAPPTVLCSSNPWSRTTPLAAYTVGKAVFAAIADAAGVAPLQASMAEFYAARAQTLVTTAELERHLYCSLGTPVVRDLFHRSVYGQQGAPEAVPDGYCER